MEHQTEGMSKKVAWVISTIAMLCAVSLVNHYYYNADILPQLSKWPRLAILMLAGVAFSVLVSSALVKIWSVVSRKKPPVAD